MLRWWFLVDAGGCWAHFFDMFDPNSHALEELAQHPQKYPTSALADSLGDGQNPEKIRN